MNWLMLASHDPLDHVLPHRFSDKLIHWAIDFTAPLKIFTISPHDTYFTNHMLMTIVAAILTLLIFIPIGRRYAAQASGSTGSAPRGFTNLIEAMMVFIRENVARPVLGDKTDRFMPFLWTVFFYILICNLLGMIPLDSIIYLASGKKLQHIGGTATGNIMVTAGLAICAFMMIHFSGIAEIYRNLVAGTYGHHDHHDPVNERAQAQGHGDVHDKELHGGGHAYGLAYTGKDEYVKHHHPQGKSPAVAAVAAPLLYIWNFAPHVFKPEKSDSVMAMAQWVMDLAMWAVLLALELLGAVIKAFALTIRLFANMIAGHVVLASLLALILVFKGSMVGYLSIGGLTAVGSAALSCLELFVCFLQAYVFTFLTTLFIGAAVSPEH